MTLKNLVYILLMTGLMSACASGRATTPDMPGSPNLVKENVNDKEEYELHILDPGFQTWFRTYGRPMNYHSPEYYEAQNRQYVVQWNQKVSELAAYGDTPFQNRVDYDPAIDYGVQLNHELFWYFRYIESNFGGQYNFGYRRGR